jgi:hypothetical protein
MHYIYTEVRCPVQILKESRTALVRHVEEYESKEE